MTTQDIPQGSAVKTTITTTLPSVNQVRYILLTLGLPYELTDIILTYAEYYALHTTKRATHLRIQASSEYLNNAKWIYMISDPVPEVCREDGQVVPTKVQSVRFQMRSCDQGWGGFSEGKNTYRNSYTWFETSILRPRSFSSSPTSSLISPSPPQWITTLTTQPINYTFDLSSPSSPPPSPITSPSSNGDNTAAIEYTEILSPYRRRAKRWLVQMNVQASRHIRTHTVTWSQSSAIERKARESSGDSLRGVLEPEYDEKMGSGRGFGFVDNLQAGDRIALVARALYPGWEHNVYEAEIEVAYQT